MGGRDPRRQRHAGSTEAVTQTPVSSRRPEDEETRRDGGNAGGLLQAFGSTVAAAEQGGEGSLPLPIGIRPRRQGFLGWPRTAPFCDRTVLHRGKGGVGRRALEESRAERVQGGGQGCAAAVRFLLGAAVFRIVRGMRRRRFHWLASEGAASLRDCRDGLEQQWPRGPGGRHFNVSRTLHSRAKNGLFTCSSAAHLI